jgi:hypothetical protein
MLASDMFACSACDVSLSKRWSSGLKPWDSSSLKARLYAVRIEGPVRVDMGAACIEFEA